MRCIRGLSVTFFEDQPFYPNSSIQGENRMMKSQNWDWNSLIQTQIPTSPPAETLSPAPLLILESAQAPLVAARNGSTDSSSSHVPSKSPIPLIKSVPNQTAITGKFKSTQREISIKNKLKHNLYKFSMTKTLPWFQTPVKICKVRLNSLRFLCLISFQILVQTWIY